MSDKIEQTDPQPADVVEAARPASAKSAPAQPATPEAPEIVPNDRFGMIFDHWVNDCIRDSPASRDTSVWNHLTTIALPELRRRLNAAG